VEATGEVIYTPARAVLARARATTAMMDLNMLKIVKVFVASRVSVCQKNVLIKGAGLFFETAKASKDRRDQL